MIWFVDIKEAIESSRESFSWQEMIRYCRKAQAERLLLYFLLLAEPILGLKVDPQILDGLGKNHISAVESKHDGFALHMNSRVSSRKFCLSDQKLAG